MSEANFLNIDSRDGSRELFSPLLAAGCTNVQLSNLEFGDFNFVGYHPWTKEIGRAHV